MSTYIRISLAWVLAVWPQLCRQQLADVEHWGMIVAVNLTTPPAMMLAAEQCENCAAVPAIPNCLVTDPQCAVFIHQPVFVRGTQPWSFPCFSEHFLEIGRASCRERGFQYV